MDFTFVVNGETESRKRKTVSGACEKCKKRKKRCIHHTAQSQMNTFRSKSTSSAPPSEDQHDAERVADTVLYHEERSEELPKRRSFRNASTPPPTTRFVGDLNPEASMITEAQTERTHSRDRHSLGIWLEQENGYAQRTRPAQNTGKSRSGTQLSNAYTAEQPPGPRPLLPDEINQMALFEIYFSRFHPLLPILDENQFRKEVSTNTASPTLIQAVCLVISRDARAEKHLVLPGVSPTVLSPLQFSSHLHNDLRTALAMKRERNRIHLIQALALLSLHTDSGPDGMEDSSMHLAIAIHHAQTIGLHLGRSNGHRRSYDALFWCLWCLSIFNSAHNGRPMLICDMDIGLKLEDVYEFCHPAFRMMGTLCGLLSRVICLYTPTADPGVHGLAGEFPSFEIIVHRSNGWDVDPSMVTSLELFYHAISILSYRTRSTDDLELAEPSLSSLRQALAVQQVMRILNHTPIHLLLTFPMVPYAISLALSHTYRQFRRSRCVTKRAIAEEQLESYVRALESMSDRFQPALTMGAIGRKVLMQIQHLHQTVARQAAEASDAHEAQADDQQMAPATLATGTTLEKDNAIPSVDLNVVPGYNDGFSDFGGLLAEDGTLQAMDTVFDNFMGLDLPNELFNASLAEGIFEPADEPTR